MNTPILITAWRRVEKLEKLLLAIFEDKVRRKKLKLQGIPKSQWHKES